MLTDAKPLGIAFTIVYVIRIITLSDHLIGIKPGNLIFGYLFLSTSSGKELLFVIKIFRTTRHAFFIPCLHVPFP